jgi:hypothetical protein
MPDTLVCGDLHGRLEIARELLEEKDKRIIFIGDYVDSFDRSIEDQQELLEMILDALDTREDVSALMGNHELSYLEPMHYKASGFKWVLDSNMRAKNLYPRMRVQLDHWIEEDGFLFTHAGVSLNWIPKKDKEDPLGFLAAAPLSHMYAIGYSRGGNSTCGGPLWCDYYDEFVPLPGVKQVFGHTARTNTVPGIRHDGEGNYCVDCLDRVTEILEISNGIAVPRKL